MGLPPGDQLGPYEILSLIGEGGMGEVYRARDTRLDRVVAIKVSKEQFSERFEREARAVAALNHPNICQLYDVGPNYLVMEFIEGSPLQGPMPVEKAVEQAGQILDALDAAHRKRVTHRDLKPANILVTKQGIKLLDFGLAKQAAPLEDADATVVAGLSKKGQIVGTLQYMAPEQLEGKVVDPRSDLFAFGCVLYEMLSGKRAFEGTSAASVIAAILEREPAPLELSPPLDRVIRRCLAKDPDARFQNALDLKAALVWALQPEPVVRETAGVTRSLRGWMTATAVLSVALIGVAVAYVRKRPVEAKPIRFQIFAPEGEVSSSGYPRVSPDGTKIAFAVSRDGVRRFRIRSLDSMDSTLVPGSDGAIAAIWSPDSKQIAFRADGKLKKVDLAGGSAKILCDWSSNGPPFGTWSAQGYILFTDVSRILKVSQNGGTPETVIQQDATRGERFLGFPEFFPDGQRFLYVAMFSTNEQDGLYAGSLDQKNPKERTRVFDSKNAGLLSTGPDGTARLLHRRGQTLLSQEVDPSALTPRGDSVTLATAIAEYSAAGAFSVSGNGSVLAYQTGTLRDQRQLAWFGRDGTKLSQATPAKPYYGLQLAPDGRRVVATVEGQSRSDREIWVHDLERGASSLFVSDNTRSESGLWSPDGERIAFVSFRPDGIGIYAKSASGAGPEELLVKSQYFKYPSSWSRDGRYLLFGQQGPTDVWVYDTREKKATVVVGTEAAESQGQFSPDGRWVAYVSNESRKLQVYAQSFPKGDRRVMISTGGGVQPRWSHDGKELFYVTQEGKLMAVRIGSSATALEASAPRELFTALSNRGLSGTLLYSYDVSPDGKRFLFITDPEGDKPEPITVVVNWTAGLK